MINPSTDSFIPLAASQSFLQKKAPAKPNQNQNNLYIFCEMYTERSYSFSFYYKWDLFPLLYFLIGLVNNIKWD